MTNRHSQCILVMHEAYYRPNIHIMNRLNSITCRVSSRIICLGGKIVCKDQLCVKHDKVLSPLLRINHQCTKKHKARVFIIRYCINCQNFFFGGEVGGFGGGGGSFPPPPVYETLTCTVQVYYNWLVILQEKVVRYKELH